MEKSIFKRKDGKIQLSYPFNEHVHNQLPNRSQAKVVQESIEGMIAKKGLKEEYDLEMSKALATGAVVELTPQDMIDWKGPVHYITHFPVKKESSASTKVRIVSNSAMPNSRTGKSFNDLLRPVPNALNEIYDVTLQWRAHTVALMFDLSKAYQTIKTGLTERHLRRFLYKFKGQEWKTYAYDAANFGNGAAAMALELVKKYCSRHGMSIDELVANQLV